MEATNIYLRGDRRVHTLRILKPDTPYSEGACGLQGELASITDDPLTCDDCIARLAHRSVEIIDAGGR